MLLFGQQKLQSLQLHVFFLLLPVFMAGPANSPEASTADSVLGQQQEL
jgi:hypothetical protein